MGRKNYDVHDPEVDPRYQNRTVGQFVNYIMRCGKKSTAEQVFYGALDLIKKRIPEDEPLDVFLKAVENCKPYIEVRSRRVGGATYQVPTEIDKRRQNILAMRWIREAARGRKGKPMAERLALELAAAYRREGEAFTKRENVHRMAEANKAFAHFAW
ncbi:MAG: 30S ribosomal protein S7 [Planctomycetes bacterium]|nr:30S ribosomal protein S7 [Planctomycetota bacterium]